MREDDEMQRTCLVTLFFLLMPLYALNAAATKQEVPLFTDEFIVAAFGDSKLQPALQLLINNHIPIQMIIEAALKAGHSADAITTALYLSDLPDDQAILHSMQSHMPSDTVLNSLKKQGVGPFDVLRLLIKNKADTNSILSTCEYLLNQDYTKFQMMEILMNAGADRNLIVKVSKHLNIPPATVLQAYQETNSDFGKFGHVYTRSSLPQPALIAVGVAHIHDCDGGKDRPPISPYKP
jgi:hypothetical protein